MRRDETKTENLGNRADGVCGEAETWRILRSRLGETAVFRGLDDIEQGHQTKKETDCNAAFGSWLSAPVSSVT